MDWKLAVQLAPVIVFSALTIYLWGIRRQASRAVSVEPVLVALSVGLLALPFALQGVLKTAPTVALCAVPLASWTVLMAMLGLTRRAV